MNPRQRAIFLDRDGTLIVDKDYLSDPAQVEFPDGVFEGLRLLQALEFSLVVITNQSGIGRGMFRLQDAVAVNDRVGAVLREQGIHLFHWYMCPHAPEEKCRCRKPRPGLIERAVADLGVDPTASFLIGDKRSDLELASAVGATGILIETDRGSADAAWALKAGLPVVRSFVEASRYLLDSVTPLPREVQE